MDRTAEGAEVTPTLDEGADAPVDGRRWLIRKATGGMGAAPFDTKQASIIGPDTEPIWLAAVDGLVPQAEFDALCEIVDALVECVVTSAPRAQWELERAVWDKLGDRAADAVDEITRGCRWDEFESAPLTGGER